MLKDLDEAEVRLDIELVVIVMPSFGLGYLVNIVKVGLNPFV